MSNYKTIPISFNLNNKNDLILYNWLVDKRGRGAFIKDILETTMNETTDTRSIIINAKTSEPVLTNVDEALELEQPEVHKEESAKVKITDSNWKM